MLSLKRGDKIFLVGIGGAGMTALAYFLKSAGYSVFGSDILCGQNVKKLEKDGFKIFGQHSSENIKGAKLVIYTSAVKKDNAEIKAARKSRIKTLSRAKACQLISKEFKNVIAVSGTHGKTTVSSMIYHILKSSGYRPSSLIGGDFDGNGGGIFDGKDFLVIEACEYAKNFLLLRPTVGVVLNIDNDHLEVYKTEKKLKGAFEKFAARSKKAIVCSDFGLKSSKNTLFFGTKAKDKYRAVKITESEGFCYFDLYEKDKFLSRVKLKISGKHNALNALAAISVCLEYNLDFKNVKSAIGDFSGVKRRFEKIYECEKFTLYDDYGHHPSEIQTVIDTAKSRGYKHLTLVFQPFTFSRTAILFNDFIKVLKKADCVIVCPIMSGREENIYGINSKQLVKRLENAFYADDFDTAASCCRNVCKEGECIVTVGCGNVYEVGKKIISNYEKSE